MSIAAETAASYFLLAQKAAERGEVQQALYYSERGQELLLRPSVEIEALEQMRREKVRCPSQVFAQ